VITDPDMEYLRGHLARADLKPFPWEGEDRNLSAFRSYSELVAWYCQPPGKDGQPYRDRSFYCRELAHVSRVIQPRTVVEFGTSLGIGVCLLHWLNPSAEIVTVDVVEETFLPGDRRVPVGYIARLQGFRYHQVIGDSADYDNPEVDLCFIDGCHEYESVLRDSYRAYENRSEDHNWGIVWHDYNDRHLGVVRAVQEFCAYGGLQLQTRPDSDTVWVIGGK
jgi:hypothetical protein